MKRAVKVVLVFMVMMFGMAYNSVAQCAMCRATVENNVSNGDTTVGAGLNMGILYLFLAPYVLLTLIGFFWYRNVKKRKRRMA